MALVWQIIATLLLAAARDSHGQEPLATCGSCWCVTGQSGCPSTEANSGFSEDVSTGFATLEMANPSELPTLLSSGGEECFPLSHLGTIEKYPKSELPPCEFPAMSDVDGAVCGFIFNNEDVTCNGNSYEMKTFASSSDAESAGAVVTHESACGVCSNAQDLAVMGSKNTEVSQKFQSCGTAYYTQVQVLSKDPNSFFDELVACIKELGYTNSCGLLWAHQVAVSSSLCVNECIGGAPLYGDPPACEYGDCIKCTAEKEGVAFNKFAGRTNLNSGIRETVIRSCSDFASIVHDPQCSMSDATGPMPDTPEQRSAGTVAGMGMYALVVIIGIFVGF